MQQYKNEYFNSHLLFLITGSNFFNCNTNKFKYIPLPLQQYMLYLYCINIFTHS